VLLSKLEYLRLIAEGLTQDVMPELSSEGARATVHIAVEGLRELIQREETLPAVIDKLAPEGLRLAERLAEFSGVVSNQTTGPVTSPEDFTALMRRLDEGAKGLLAEDKRDAATKARISAWLRDVANWENEYYTTFRSSPRPQLTAERSAQRPLTAQKLTAHLRERITDRGEIEVRDFAAVPGGFSNETFFFTLSSSTLPDDKFVIRKKSPDPFFKFWANRLRDEYEIVSVLSKRGLSVARPLWLFEKPHDVDGAFYVMTRAAGKVAGTLSNTYSGNQELPEELMLSLASFLARLHSVPLREFAEYFQSGDTPVRLGDSTTEAVRKNVDYLCEYWRSCIRLPSPSEAFMLDWLRNNVPDNPRPPVLVHGDCFVHNLIVEKESHITAVVDWESAHFSDPATDLAYIKDPVSRYIDWRKFMRHYRDCGGPEVNEADFPYYKALLNFRNSWGTNIAVARIPRGFHDIRMIPLGSEFFTAFLKASVESTRIA
jgi:aminoglycoside phosphotransferase (APT) family kinase protein